MEVKAAIYHYCNYQERCQQQVRDKLYALGCRSQEVEELIAMLIEDGLLNEQRFAEAIARGKFRMNKWGRVRIVQQLKQHRISAYCIKMGLKQIDDEAYLRTLEQLAEKKWGTLRGEKNSFIRKGKLSLYLQQKGFERDLIADCVSQIADK